MSVVRFPSTLPADSCDVLNGLVVLLGRSLANYLVDARPDDAAQQPEALRLLDAIASDQRATVDRLADLILDRDCLVSRGSFPMDFTSLHDLSMQYLQRKLVDHQRQIIAGLEQAVDALSHDGPAQAVVEEALGAAKAHLDGLMESSRGQG